MFALNHLVGFGASFGANGNDANTKLLLHLDSDANDASSAAHNGTLNGTASISSTQSKFGGNSLRCPGGSGNNLSVADHADFRVTSDYTIDLWARADGTAGFQPVFWKNNAAGGFCSYGITISGGNWVFYSSSNGTSFDLANAKVIGAAAATTWVHLAVVRNGNNYYMFKDGVLSGNEFTQAGTPLYTADAIFLGQQGAIANVFTGYVDEARFSNIARWTAAFTPPTAAYS